MLNSGRIYLALSCAALLGLNVLVYAFSPQGLELVEVESKILNFGQYDPRGFNQLAVDSSGALYFSSPQRILKFRADGQMEFEIDISRFDVKFVRDVRVGEDGTIVVGGTAFPLEKKESIPEAVILTFGPQGSLIRSSTWKGILLQRIELGKKGEILFSGELPDKPKARTAIFKGRFGGTALLSFGEEIISPGEGIRDQFIGASEKGYLLLKYGSDGVVLKEFTVEGRLVRSTSISLPVTAMPEEVAKASKDYQIDARRIIDRFFPLSSDRVLITSGVDYAWQPSGEGMQSRFASEVLVVSTDGSRVEKVQKKVVGTVKAIDREGFLYLVTNIVRPNGVALQVTKAKLQ